MQQTFGWALLAIMGVNAIAQTIHGREGITLPLPPAVQATPVVDDYFGTKITDNYRWLEDAKSPATRAFIDAQNAYTAQYFKQTSIRPQAVEGLTALENISETSPPFERANNYFSPAGWPASSSSQSMCDTAGRDKTSDCLIRQS